MKTELKEIESDSPRLYVGTYHKYNSGSIYGAWLDLDDYSDKEDFYEACKELHKDEEDPEYMFQDFENFPKDFYSESGGLDKIYEWLDFDENERTIIAEYLTVDSMRDFQEILDCFHGEYKNEEDYAYEYVESTGMLNNDTSWAHYFDYERFAKDLFMDMFITDNGYVFSNQ